MEDFTGRSAKDGSKESENLNSQKNFQNEIPGRDSSLGRIDKDKRTNKKDKFFVLEKENFFSKHPIPKAPLYFALTGILLLFLLKISFTGIFARLAEILFLLVPVLIFLINLGLYRWRIHLERDSKVREVYRRYYLF